MRFHARSSADPPASVRCRAESDTRSRQFAVNQRTYPIDSAHARSVSDRSGFYDSHPRAVDGPRGNFQRQLWDVSRPAGSCSLSPRISPILRTVSIKAGARPCGRNHISRGFVRSCALLSLKPIRRSGLLRRDSHETNNSRSAA